MINIKGTAITVPNYAEKATLDILSKPKQKVALSESELDRRTQDLNKIRAKSVQASKPQSDNPQRNYNMGIARKWAGATATACA